ncbi:MAG TPA: phosphoribosyltransferase family protein [Gemmatimonadaceae bacterium]
MVEESMNLGFMRAGLDVQPVLFANREDAGERLGKALLRYRGQRPLVLGIPRGGVPVAAEVARAVDGDLDVIVARKLGSPFSPELAVGAVTADGAVYLNKQTIDELGVPGDYLDQVTKEKRAEAEARERRFRAGRAPLPIEGRTVILVDDGLATGSTMVAAARSVRSRHPKRLVIAVPVAPRDTCVAMHAEADEVTCLEMPEFFMAVGSHYRDFSQTEDEDVERILGVWHASPAPRT